MRMHPDAKLGALKILFAFVQFQCNAVCRYHLMCTQPVCFALAPVVFILSCASAVCFGVASLNLVGYT